MNSERRWPESLDGVEWLRLAQPQWKFQYDSTGVAIDDYAKSFAVLGGNKNEQLIAFPRSRFPPKHGLPAKYVVYDDEVFRRLVIRRFAFDVGQIADRAGLWAESGLGENYSGNTTEYFAQDLPSGWASVPHDGIGHLYRHGVEVLASDGGDWGDYLFVAHTDGFHADHVLAFRIFGNVSVSFVDLKEAVRNFVATRPEFSIGWWRKLLPPGSIS